MIRYIMLGIMTYFFGSIPTGVWLGKTFKGIDIRTVGSKNSGATNAYRNLGPTFGILTLIGDALKGYLPLLIASKYGVSSEYIVVLGLIGIFGHTFSCFLNFNGGKGVATSLGVFIFLAPTAILYAVIGFILVVSITKYVSLASMVAALILPIGVILLPVKIGVDKQMLSILSVIIGSFVIYKHKANITRLLNGTEAKITDKKKN